MLLTKCADMSGCLRTAGYLIAIWASAIAGAESGHAAEGCASLKDLKIDDATITAAESVPAGIVHGCRFEELRQPAGVLPGDRHAIARARLIDSR